MAIPERIHRNIDNRIWNPGTDYFPVKNRYTAGVAGQRFFEELKDKGKIFGTKCTSCAITYVPARIYCERCFARLEEWVDVGAEGTLYSFTAVYKTKSGEDKNSPSIVGAVKIADSLLIHHLDECKESDLYIGMDLKCVLKPKADRTGAITDIKYFKPL